MGPLVPAASRAAAPSSSSGASGRRSARADRVEYRTVYAEAGRFSRVGDTEDAEQVIVTTTGGAWANIEPSWSRPVARHGSLVDEDGVITHLPYGRSMDAELLDDWLTAIRFGSAPPVPMDEGWKATQVALAALTSARYGTVVDITEQENGSA